MKIIGISAALAAVVATSTAMAADLPMKAPLAPVVPAFSWTGFYIGGHLGDGWVDNSTVLVTQLTPTSFPIGTPITPQSHSGFLGGGQIGYNVQFGQFVLGVEGDWTGTDINACSRTFGLAGAYADSCLKTKWTATAAGRLGYAWANWLVYAKGGVAWGDFSATGTTSNAANVLTSTSAGGETRTGFVVGGGLEYAFWNNWSVKVEYNYMDFGTENVNRIVTTLPGGVSTAVLRSNDTQVQEIKVGVNYRFNWR